MKREASQSPAALLQRLGNLLNIPPISVEIIPGDGSDWSSGWQEASIEQDHRPFLYVQGHLGVPRKVLSSVYMAAVRDFMTLKPSYRHTGVSPPDAERLAHLSAVILLANSAHQTALNARKRLVSWGLLDSERELHFCTALLVVHDSSKQSLLWHHRRWLLCWARKALANGAAPIQQHRQGDTLRHVELSVDSLRSEFSVVAQACETYPRNYFAWTHRSLCLEALMILAFLPTPLQDSYRALLLDELMFARIWIERHVSDFSAVHYLCNMHAVLLLEARPPLPEDASGVLDIDRVNSRTLRASLYEHAKTLLTTYPEHESMWLYFRAAIHICSSEPTFQLDGSESSGNIPSSVAEIFIIARPVALAHAERHRTWLERVRKRIHSTP